MVVLGAFEPKKCWAFYQPIPRLLRNDGRDGRPGSAATIFLCPTIEFEVVRGVVLSYKDMLSVLTKVFAESKHYVFQDQSVPAIDYYPSPDRV